jgi:penicillin-binding protein 2
VEPISSLNDPLEEDAQDQLPDDRPSNPRMFWLGFGLVILMVALWFRLYQLQIGQGADYRDQADNNRFREVTIPAPRGVIYDRNQVVLARNRPSYTVGIVDADFPDPTQRAAVLQRLAELLNVAPTRLVPAEQQSAEAQFTFVPLATNVPENVAFTIEERHLDLPGVHVQLQPTREYTLGTSAAPIIGYVGRITDPQFRRLEDDPVHRYSADDLIGQSGIEAAYEAQLRGEPGQEQMEVDATGRQVRSLKITNPVPGRNLTLTIDAGLQKQTTEILEGELNRYQSASAVAIDPRNGEILALVHVPSYDDNLFAQGISDADYQRIIQDPHHPLLNGAIAAAYPPGSTFDIVTALAGLETGVITPTERIDCPGFITVPNRYDPTIGTRLVDGKAVGSQDVAGAVANACDVFFYEVGGGDPYGKWNGVGAEDLGRFAHFFGLGDPPGSDLAEEASGLVPTVRWKRQQYNQEWVSMDTYQLAVGTGYLAASPLQMANLIATIANGGTLYRPQLVLSTSVGAAGSSAAGSPEPIRRVPIKPEYLDVVRHGLIDALKSGQTTAGTKVEGASRAAAVDGWTGGGLTSSIAFGAPDASGKLPTHGWFVGFAPADQPTIAIAVFLEYGTGAGDAAQVARQILTYYHQHDGSGSP